MIVPSQVLTQLQAIFEKDSQADRITLVWPEPLPEPVIMHDMDGRQLRVVYCVSELAMREQLVEHGEETDERYRLVMLSSFDHARLANDVLARIWRNEPQRISPWRALQQILKVRQIDPRLTRTEYRWIAKTLLSAHEAYKDKVQFGEVLDQDNAWQALTCGLMNYNSDSVDLDSLFQWSLSGGCDKAYASLPEDMKANLGDWLKPGIPDYEDLVMRVLGNEKADQLLAVGLACSVLYHPELLETSGTALKARNKLVDAQALIAARAVFNDRYLGSGFANADVLKGFGRQALNFAEHLLAEQRAKGLQGAVLQQSFSTSEQMLASLDITPLLIYSHVLPAGFRLRLDAMAKVLEKGIKGKSLDSARIYLEHLKAHHSAKTPSASEQVMRAEMAIRLCDWLHNDNSQATQDASLLQTYVEHGGFADWARSKIWQGDIHEGLSQVYQKLSERVGQHREKQNEAFAGLLPSLARGDKQKGFLPVEKALDEIVTPLAKDHLVLLLVLDGMSQAVYRELAQDLVQQNWVEWQQSSHSVNGLVSAFPTVTKVSRCSLFSGELAEGVASDEKKAFAGHKQLKALASTKFPPQLFHKADLEQSGSGALASEVRAVLAGTEHRITGVVINAIDDHLSSNAQLTMGWKMDTIALLRQVMEAAREAGRVVVMTSDHGHVLDHDMKGQLKSDGGERYKPADAPVEQGELVLTGDRVVANNNQVVLPWSEKIRYASRKKGYHGGGSLQEVMIPLGIYASSGVAEAPAGWREVPRYTPDWWQHQSDDVVIAVEKASPATEVSAVNQTNKKAQAAAEMMDDMFSAPDETASSPAGNIDWKAQLLTSEVFKQAKSRAGRNSIRDEQILQMMELLEANSYQLMMAVLVKSLGIPKLRMRGFLAGVQKLLNVDGYAILSIDRTSETIKLNVESLKTQFELHSHGQ